MLDMSTVPPNGHTPTDAQRAVAAHGEGPLLVLGEAGSGRTEALALRLEALVAAATRAEHVLVLCRSRAARARLRERAEILLDRPHEELWIHTYEEAAEALLREYSIEAGLDPFFATVGPGDRLAILLDRLDELPLRRHEIRGNPAGLLARLLRRIDLLKAESVAPSALREWAVAAERAASNAADRERAEREIEFAELYARHDRILREAGSLDGGDLVLELGKLLAHRADVGGGGHRTLRRRARRRARGRRDRPPRGARGDRRPPQPRLRRRSGPGDAALSRRRRGEPRCLPRRPPGASRDRPR